MIFLMFLKERLIISKELLSEDGFIWIHSDQTIGHYIKILCDEIFGQNNFVADIITARVKKNNSNSNNFNIANDNLYLYRKSNKAILNKLYKKSDKKPYWHAFDAKGQGSGRYFGEKFIEPPVGTHWRWSQENINEGMKKGILRLNRNNKPEYLVNPKKIKIDSNWLDIPGYSFKNQYPTEKNIEIINRVITASTNNEDDIVLDYFTGSGTTLESAILCNRKYIGCDISEISMKTIKKRFKNIQIEKL